MVRQSEDGTAYRWFLLWAGSVHFLCGLKQTAFKKKDQNPHSSRSCVLWAICCKHTVPRGLSRKPLRQPHKGCITGKVPMKCGEGWQQCAWDPVSTAGVPALCQGTAQLNAPPDEPGEMSVKQGLDAAVPQGTGAGLKAAAEMCSDGERTSSRIP